MKKLILFIVILSYISGYGQVGINTDESNPDGSAMLDVESTTKGVLISRMTKTQRDAVSSPATGLMIYQTDDTTGFYYYNGTSWDLIGSGAFSIDNLLDGKTGGNSVFLGSGAGANDDGSDNRNVAVGDSALNAITSGSGNTATGYGALYSNTTGNHHTATGYGALYSNTAGIYNTANGFQALYSNTAGFYNTANGYKTLQKNTTGSQNTANGNWALHYNTTGNCNTANGIWALYCNTNGNNNTANGYLANHSNQSGSNNTIIGYEAGRGTTYHSKSGNVFLGYQAGYSAITGDTNVFLGYQAGYSEQGSNKLYIENSNSASPLIYGEFDNDYLKINGDLETTGYFEIPTTTSTAGIIKQNGSRIIHTYGSDNLFLGKDAGNFTLTGNKNVAVGREALNANTSGANNTANGVKALYSNKTGSWNTANGTEVLYSDTSGSRNTANGYKVLYYNTSGGNNTATGYKALFNNTTGNNNTAIGYSAGMGTATHSKSGNVFLGYFAGYNEYGDNKLYIENSNSDSPLIWGDFTSNRIVINGNSGDNINDRTFFSNGDAGGTAAWYNDSDVRLKKNIRTIPSSLDKVLHLRGVNYEWKETEHHAEGLQMGFIAQEVEEVIPEVVDNSGDHYSMQYAPITALLVEAVKEQQEMIDELQLQNQALLERLERLEKRKMP